MKACFFIILIFGIAPNNSHAQNLVPNPGFELISTCNVTGLMDAMQNVIADWSTYDYANNSPDIFNDCFTFPSIQLPNSSFGFTFANSGSGCGGIGANPLQNDYREALSNQLIQPLTKDSAYCVSFYVKNSETGNEEYYSEDLGMFFSQNSTDHFEVRQRNSDILPPPVTGNSWTEVKGYYIAEGGEEFIHIGFFGPSHSYYIEPGSSGVIYYFIDDVSVTPCNKDSLLNVTLDLPNVFTPNGDGENDFYTFKQQNIKTLDVMIYNRWGNLIIQYDGKTMEWNGKDSNSEDVSDGVYFIKAIGETNFGEIFQKQQVVHVFRESQ